MPSVLPDNLSASAPSLDAGGAVVDVDDKVVEERHEVDDEPSGSRNVVEEVPMEVRQTPLKPMAEIGDCDDDGDVTS